jgi:hypothetical protein
LGNSVQWFLKKIRFQLDLVVKETEERNASGLQQLADLVEANDEMEAIVSKHLCEKGLTIPQYGRSRSQISWKSEASELSARISSTTKSMNFFF